MAGRRGSAAHADVAEERAFGVDRGVVRNADPADDGAGLGDGERGVGRLLGADAFEHRVSAVAVGQVLELLDGFVAAGGDDVGRAPLAGELVARLGLAAEHDDALGAEHPGRQDAGQTDCAVTDDSDGVALADLGADGGVVAGRHDVGQGQQRGQRLVGEVRAGHLEQRAVGLRNADELGLAAVVGAASAEEAAVDAGGVEAGLGSSGRCRR